MAIDIRVDLNKRAIEDLRAENFLKDFLLTESKAIIAEAMRRAPKRTGRGAASIHAEPQLVHGEWVSQISWDRAHGYMAYQELGTRYMRPHSFLRPAIGLRAASPIR